MTISSRYYWVDALRGLAALSVVVFHYHHFYLADAYDRGSIPPVSDFPYAAAIGLFYSSFASNAVEMFWLISGFVFAHVYLHRSTSAWQFGVARFARLYPLHFVTLIYVATLQLFSLNVIGHWQVYANNDTRHFILQLFMSSNWITWSRGLSFNGPIWSVSLELIVYAIFFFSLPLLRRRPLLITCVLLSASWAIFILFSADLPLLRIVVFRCAGYFFIGTLLYLLHPGQTTLRMIVIAALGFGLFLLGLMLELEDVAISGFAIAAVSLATRLDYIFPALGMRLSALGDISYSVYLVHVPIQMTVLVIADLFFDGTRAFVSSYLTLPLYMATSVVLAFIVHRAFERPVGAFLRQKMTSAPANNTSPSNRA